MPCPRPGRVALQRCFLQLQAELHLHPPDVAKEGVKRGGHLAGTGAVHVAREALQVWSQLRVGAVTPIDGPVRKVRRRQAQGAVGVDEEGHA